LKEFLTHLRPMERSSLVTKWSDKEINPGSDWFLDIKQAIESTQTAVFLVSPDFLASDFICEHELKPILELSKSQVVRVLWFTVRACDYESSPLKGFQAVIDPRKPLPERRQRRDRVWVDICAAIRKELGWKEG
jgi:hypothetical protein